MTRSGSSLLGGRRGLEPPHARAPSPGGTAARAARSLSASLVPSCVVFVGAVPGRLGNKAEEPQVSAVRCQRTGVGGLALLLSVCSSLFFLRTHDIYRFTETGPFAHGGLYLALTEERFPRRRTRG